MLRSFSFGLIYGVNELPENVINLFSELLQHPEINIEHASEIVEAGLKGNIGVQCVVSLHNQYTTH